MPREARITGRASAPFLLASDFHFRQFFVVACKRAVVGGTQTVGAQLPLTAAVMEMMQALRADGLGTADHSALACYYEKLAKVEVTR